MINPRPDIHNLGSDVATTFQDAVAKVGKKRAVSVHWLRAAWTECHVVGCGTLSMQAMHRYLVDEAAFDFGL